MKISSDKHYLISGVSKGLGHDLALYLLSEGYKVSVLSREQKTHSSFFTEKVTNFYLDFDHLSDFAEDRFLEWIRLVGLPNTVVHCAGGGYGLRSPTLKSREMSKLFDGNLLGAVAINSLIVPLFQKARSGTVIHVGSTAATQSIGSVGYNTVKAGLNAYVRSLGNSVVADNVLVCGINPGAFDATNNAMYRLKNSNSEAYLEFLERKLPRNRLSSTQEIIDVLVFLGDSKNLALAGSMVAVDGGESVAY